jgi:DNA replication licensing factor MCM3
LVFIVLDEDDPELDRNIADRVIRNHQFPSETASLITGYDDKIIEPDINQDDEGDHQVFEKHNKLLHGNSKKLIFTKNFLKKYLYYAKKVSVPVLSDEAKDYITNTWTELRSANYEDKENNYQAVPITVRTLETIIRLSTAHAKGRLSKTVTLKDCQFAEKILQFTLFGEEKKQKKNMNIDIEEEVKENEDDDIEIEKENEKSSKIKMSKSKETNVVLNAKIKDEYILTDEYTKLVFSTFIKMSKDKTKDYSSGVPVKHLLEELKKTKDKVVIENETHLLQLIKKLDLNNSLFFEESTNLVILVS